MQTGKLEGGNYLTILEEDLDQDNDQNNVMEYDPLNNYWLPSKRLVAVWDDREIEMLRPLQPPPIQKIQHSYRPDYWWRNRANILMLPCRPLVALQQHCSNPAVRHFSEQPSGSDG